jgi:hypothetical protein
VRAERNRGGGANRGVSRVVDVETKLTEATITARTRRRPRNKLGPRRTVVASSPVCAQRGART